MMLTWDVIPKNHTISDVGINIMPYYGLFSRDLHILDVCGNHIVRTTFMFQEFLTILTIGNEVAKDAPLWHHIG